MLKYLSWYDDFESATTRSQSRRLLAFKYFFDKYFKYRFEKYISINVDLGLAGGDYNILANVAGFALDLDAGLEELLKLANLHNTILDWVGAVNGECVRDLLGFLARLLNWGHSGV